MRSKGVRRVAVVVALVAVMVVGRVQPAGAFLSALDPAGWAVVAQMAAVISQAVAIKRQVENVRNQARAEFFGKLAPLTGKLGVVSDWLENARRVGGAVYNPQVPTTLPPNTFPVFNRPMDECAGATGAEPCMPPIRSAALPMRTIGALADNARAAVRDTSPNPIIASYTADDRRLRQTINRLETRGRANIRRTRAAAERAENERAMRRALIEEQMAIVEEWRGCQEAPPGAWNPAGDERLPCVTNGGLGQGDDGGGTQGAQEDLRTKLEALDTYQDGDVSQVQLDTMQTQLIIMLGRFQAVRLEREAHELERREEERMIVEAERRRSLQVLERDLRCQERFGPQSHFIEDGEQNTPPTGSCRRVVDVSEQAIRRMANSCLLPGRCAS